MSTPEPTSPSKGSNPPPSAPVLLTVPHMNPSLHVKLTKSNFISWKTQVDAYLRGQDAHGFVNGSSVSPPQAIPNPITTDGAPVSILNPDYVIWYQRDQLILSVLISTLFEPLVSHAVGCATSRALWMSLEKMFTSQSRAQMMQVHYQLATSKKGTSSVTDYFQKMKLLSDTMAAIGQPLNDFETVSYILAGLGSEYDPFVTSITTRVDPLSLEEIYGHLLAYELRLEQHLPTADIVQPSANFTSRSQDGRGRGFRGRGNNYRGGNRGRGHPSNGRGRGSSFNNTTSSQPRHTCQVCGKQGHTAIRCYRRFDQEFQGELSTNPQAFYSSPNLISDDNWYPDTGATHHVTNEMNNLNVSSEEYTGADKIRVGNGSGLSITHKGSATLSISRTQFLLQNLLLVPDICKNLLSVSKFSRDNNVFFEFHSTHFLIKDCHTQSLLHQGPLKDGLYQLQHPNLSSQSIKHALLGVRTSANTWHGRLGHPALRTVQRVLSTFRLPVSANKATPCSACQLAKGHQQPFYVSNSVFSTPLELIYSDVWGPSPVLSINGNRYYVSFIDAFSKFTWLFPISHKSEVMNVFLKFQLMVEWLFNTKIKSVQTDWGVNTVPSTSSFNPLASCIDCLVLTLISNKVVPRENIVTLLIQLSLSLLPVVFLSVFGMRRVKHLATS